MGREKDRTGGCCYNFGDEFQLKKFGLGHNDPSLFIKPQCFPPIVYIFWTLFWALFYTVNLSFEIYYNSDSSAVGHGGKYFIYVTNLQYLMQSAYVFIDFIVTVYVFIKRKDIRDGTASRTTWYIKTQWVFFNASNAFTITVTLLYYTLLDVNFSHASIYTHLLNSVYTVLGLLFAAKPVQLLHFYQPVVPAIIYLLFSIIYHLSGADPIYTILDWNKIGKTTYISLLIVGVVVPVIHIACYMLYSVRVLVCRKCKCSGEGTVV